MLSWMFPSACRRLYVCVSKILFCICLSSGGGELLPDPSIGLLPQNLSWVAAAWMLRHCPQILYEYTRTHNFLDGFGRFVDPLEFYLVSSRGLLYSGVGALFLISHAVASKESQTGLLWWHLDRGSALRRMYACARLLSSGQVMGLPGEFISQAFENISLGLILCLWIQVGDKWISSLFLILCGSYRKTVFLPS